MVLVIGSVWLTEWASDVLLELIVWGLFVLEVEVLLV